jgi:hypothetical protein
MAKLRLIPKPGTCSAGSRKPDHWNCAHTSDRRERDAGMMVQGGGAAGEERPMSRRGVSGLVWEWWREKGNLEESFGGLFFRRRGVCGEARAAGQCQQHRRVAPARCGYPQTRSDLTLPSQLHLFQTHMPPPSDRQPRPKSQLPSPDPRLSSV